MTRVDFYLLSSAEPGAKQRVACKLADKTFRLGHRTYLLAPDRAAARTLDELLWTLEPGSFIPHGIMGEPNLQPQVLPVLPVLPILIGHEEPPPDYTDVLISLCPAVPDFFSRFQRLAELVGAEEEEKQRSRDKFRFYRDRGYPLETHQL